MSFDDKPRRSDLVDVTVTFVRESERAWCVNDGTKDVWIPKSKGELERQARGVCELTIPEWLAKEKGLI